MKVTYFATVTVFTDGAQAGTATLSPSGREVYFQLQACREVGQNGPTSKPSVGRLPKIGDKIILILASELLLSRTLQASAWGFSDIHTLPIVAEPETEQLVPIKNVIHGTRFADDVGEIPRHGRQTRKGSVDDWNPCQLVSTNELPTTPWHAYGVRGGKGPNRPHSRRVHCTGIAA